MNEPTPCSPNDDCAEGPRLMSHASIGNVVLCGCGQLHLTLQYLTLRFEAPAFRELAALLVDAQRRLDDEPRAQGQAPPVP